MRTVTLRSTASELSMMSYTIDRRVTTLMVCLSALMSSSHADNNSSGKDVMMLTTKNFDGAVAETEHLFVQFCE